MGGRSATLPEGREPRLRPDPTNLTPTPTHTPTPTLNPDSEPKATLTSTSTLFNSDLVPNTDSDPNSNPVPALNLPDSEPDPDPTTLVAMDRTQLSSHEPSRPHLLISLYSLVESVPSVRGSLRTGRPLFGSAVVSTGP